MKLLLVKQQRGKDFEDLVSHHIFEELQDLMTVIFFSFENLPSDLLVFPTLKCLNLINMDFELTCTDDKFIS